MKKLIYTAFAVLSIASACSPLAAASARADGPMCIQVTVCLATH